MVAESLASYLHPRGTSRRLSHALSAGRTFCHGASGCNMGNPPRQTPNTSGINMQQPALAQRWPCQPWIRHPSPE